ncbi:MAG: hypothetical protein OYI31_01510 [Chloroflexota bacterium]|nr:hypothetical protein [Chloroflexota bacterium]MDE2942026.1 hypothetical protein [Chloroflexota bacterium]MDE3267124.1 hypothetical protein [Chloroflexota bacterium]
MPALRESKGLLYTLIVVGILALVASLYLTAWAGSPQSASAQDAGTTSTDGEATEEAPAPEIPVPDGGAMVALTPGTAETLSSPDGKVTVSIPASGPRAAGYLVYEPTTARDAEAPAPDGGSFGDTLFELTGYDEAGASMASVRFDSAATITIKYSEADLSAADSNPARLAIYKYDSAFQTWSRLTSSVDVVNGTISTSVSRLSHFAVVGFPAPPTPTPLPTSTPLPGVPTATPIPTATRPPTATSPPTATPTPLPPVVGDVAPTSGLMIGLVAVALVLMAAGGYYLRQSRQQN